MSLALLLGVIGLAVSSHCDRGSTWGDRIALLVAMLLGAGFASAVTE